MSEHACHHNFWSGVAGFILLHTPAPKWRTWFVALWFKLKAFAMKFKGVL